MAAEGFTDITARPRRLRRFLDTYGWSGNIEAFIEVVRSRAQAHTDGIRRLATAGGSLFVQLLHQGVADNLTRAVHELAELKL